MTLTKTQIYNKQWREKNREYIQARSRAYYAKNKGKYKKSDRQNRVLRKYGLTSEQHMQMLLDQQGVCAICARTETVRHKASGLVNDLAIDHCHKTGKVRALLCAACNKSLGLLKEDTETLYKMIAYINKHSTKDK